MSSRPFLVLLPIIFTISLMCSNVSKARNTNREKRNVWDLCRMAQCTTGNSCTKYIGHGCWCGLGNVGNETVDQVDECCRLHDLCYGCAETANCSPLSVSFEWQCRSKMAECLPIQASICSAFTCHCDAQFAACIGKYKDFTVKECPSVHSEIAKRKFKASLT